MHSKLDAALAWAARGKPYSVEIEAPIAEIPVEIKARLRPPNERQEAVPGVNSDTPEAIALAEHWLDTEAPIAIEGQGGDNTTFGVCCKLRDFGLSPEAALEALTLWNDRCSPPWAPDALEAKVRNAFEYASGPGGAGKSSLVLTIAAHLAVGQNFLGLEVVRAGKSIIYNAEDDREEMSQRLWAICAQYGFDFKVVSERICMLSSDDINLQLTEGKNTMNTKAIASILKAAQDPEVVFLSIDPLIEVHNLREDDNADMRFVMSILRWLAQEANVAVLVSHHTKKPAAASSASFAGDPDSARGASAIVYAARISLTLHGASRDDCDLYGIDEDQRSHYVRLDDAKMNYSLMRDRPQWLKRESVQVYQGDVVGVLIPFDAQESRKGARKVMARVLHAEMTTRAKATCSIPEAAEYLKSGDPLYEKLPMVALKSRIETYLSGGVELETGGKIVLTIGPSQKKLIVIE
jgi:hypothetical protein